MTPDDLKLMGVWQWLREYSDAAAQAQAEAGHSTVASTEELTYIVQRAVEGGHWMLTPPHILTLIHAVQQPIGRPQFTALRTQHPGTDPSIQTEDESGPTRAVAFDPVAAWRALGAVDAYLTGGLRVHGASTGKLDLIADWDDPADAGTGAIGMIHQSAHVDEIPLPSLNDGYLQASGPGNRLVGRYESAQDIIWFYVTGDELGGFPPGGAGTSQVAAPRHYLNDTKHHVVRYRAVASSRYRDCFPADSALDFTRTSDPVTVDVPCSARPAAPRILKVLPTFGWDRQVATNLKSSARIGGGIRVYLDRPWYSSGAGELLGVTLWNADVPPGDEAREAWKHLITQWGLDPIWAGPPVQAVPDPTAFPDAVATETYLTLDELGSLDPSGQIIYTGTVGVAGHEVEFDEAGQCYCDLRLDTEAYMPFIRLALTRYQPHALPDAKLSRVVLADFVQLAPDRAAVVSADPYRPRRLRVTVSGPGPHAPITTQITVTVQQRLATAQSDIAWQDADPAAVQISPETLTAGEDMALWTGTIEFTQPPAADEYRLLIREYEFIRADPGVITFVSEAFDGVSMPGRLIYAEIVLLDAALITPPPPSGAETGPGEGEGAGGGGGLPDPVDPNWDPIGDPPQPDVFDFGALPSLSEVKDLQVVDGYVKLAQAMLNAVVPGTPLAVDGKFGPLTLAAVQTFQTSWLLPVTGMIDTGTWFALALASPYPLLEPGPLDPPMSGPPVALVQQLLNLAGASPQLGINGSFTPDTQSTLEAFQAQRGLTSSGSVTPDTWAALADIPAEDEPSGTMRLTFSYDSADWAANGPLVRFVSREDLAMTAPLSDDLDVSTEGMSGFWYELQDAQGLALYRRARHMPITVMAEVPSDDQNPELVSIPLDSPKGTFQLLAPILPRAQTLVLSSSPLDPDQMDQPATVIASFDLSQLAGGQP